MSHWATSDSPVGTVAVIGGGASGSLVATHLLRGATQAVDVVLIESHRVAAGIAYGTDEPLHLLNAPSCEMSAFSDVPDDFTRFAASVGYPITGHAYVARRTYRDYLAATLKGASKKSRPDCGLDLVKEEAVALVRPTDGRRKFVIGMRHGSHVEADHVVLAIGPPPTVAPWSLLDGGLSGTKLLVDSWSSGNLHGLEIDDRVLILGTGLSMVDAVLTLHGRGHRGAIYARSRHGLLPLRQSELPIAAIPSDLDPSTTSTRELFAAVRVAAEKAEFIGEDWRAVIAGVRTQFPAIWQNLPDESRQRFLRHAQRYWEIHRHRIAPEIGRILDQLLSRGRLEIGAGKLTALQTSGNEFSARISKSGQADEILIVDAVVNCTGPSTSYGPGSRLVEQILKSGIGTMDASGLGLAVDAEGDLSDVTGAVDPRIHTVGWLRRGRFYETNAVPEIRAQAERLAKRLVGQPR